MGLAWCPKHCMTRLQELREEEAGITKASNDHWRALMRQLPETVEEQLVSYSNLQHAIYPTAGGGGAARSEAK